MNEKQPNAMLVFNTLVDTIRRLQAAGVAEPDDVAIARGGHLIAGWWVKRSASVRCKPDGSVVLRVEDAPGGAWSEVDEDAFIAAMVCHEKSR